MLVFKSCELWYQVLFGLGLIRLAPHLWQIHFNTWFVLLHLWQCHIVAMLSLHPGTVDTALSKPFSKRVPKEKLFGAEQAAQYLSQVIAERSPGDSGEFFAWDGRPIPW